MTEQAQAWGPVPEPYQRQDRSWLPACLLGCAVVFVVGLFVCGGLVWFLAPMMRGWASDVAREAIVEGIQSSELSDEDKQAVTEQVDRVVEAYRSGEIGAEELGRIFEKLVESPLLGLLVVFAADTRYVEPSGLAEEEKEQGRLALQRVARGVFEETIDEDDLEPVLDHISEKRSGGERRLKDEVSDTELRSFLADCQQLADQAEVPSEPYDLDIGEEFKRAVDRALGEP